MVLSVGETLLGWVVGCGWRGVELEHGPHASGDTCPDELIRGSTAAEQQRGGDLDHAVPDDLDSCAVGAAPQRSGQPHEQIGQLLVKVLQIRCEALGEFGCAEELCPVHREQELPGGRVVRGEPGGRIRCGDHGINRSRGPLVGVEGGLHQVALHCEKAAGRPEPDLPHQARAGAEGVVDGAVGDRGQLRDSAHCHRRRSRVHRKTLGGVQQSIGVVNARAGHVRNSNRAGAL